MHWRLRTNYWNKVKRYSALASSLVSTLHGELTKNGWSTFAALEAGERLKKSMEKGLFECIATKESMGWSIFPNLICTCILAEWNWRSQTAVPPPPTGPAISQSCGTMLSPIEQSLGALPWLPFRHYHFYSWEFWATYLSSLNYKK